MDGTKSALHKVWRKSKNVHLSPLEKKVKDATSMESLSAPTALLEEIAEATLSYAEYQQVMRMVWKRMAEAEPKKWRHVYKSLCLVEFLLVHGGDSCVDDVKDRKYQVQQVADSFEAVVNGMNNGQSVREKARQVLSLLNSGDRLKRERDEAKKKRGRGYNSGGYGGGGFGNQSTYGTGPIGTGGISSYGVDPGRSYERDDEQLREDRDRGRGSRDGGRGGRRSPSYSDSDSRGFSSSDSDSGGGSRDRGRDRVSSSGGSGKTRGQVETRGRAKSSYEPSRKDKDVWDSEDDESSEDENYRGRSESQPEISRQAASQLQAHRPSTIMAGAASGSGSRGGANDSSREEEEMLKRAIEESKKTYELEKAANAHPQPPTPKASPPATPQQEAPRQQPAKPANDLLDFGVPEQVSPAPPTGADMVANAFYQPAQQQQQGAMPNIGGMSLGGQQQMMTPTGMMPGQMPGQQGVYSPFDQQPQQNFQPQTPTAATPVQTPGSGNQGPQNLLDDMFAPQGNSNPTTPGGMPPQQMQQPFHPQQQFQSGMPQQQFQTGMPNQQMQPGQMQPGQMQPGQMQPGQMQPGQMQPNMPMMPNMMQNQFMSQFGGQMPQPGMMQPGMMQPGMMPQQPGMMQPGMMQQPPTPQNEGGQGPLW